VDFGRSHAPATAWTSYAEANLTDLVGWDPHKCQVFVERRLCSAVLNRSRCRYSGRVVVTRCSRVSAKLASDREAVRDTQG
jgi:hypothetical protein